MCEAFCTPGTIISICSLYPGAIRSESYIYPGTIHLTLLSITYQGPQTSEVFAFATPFLLLTTQNFSHANYILKLYNTQLHVYCSLH